MKNIFMQIGNGLTTLILRSPLHRMVSKSSLLVALAGRKSGNKITLPVNYFEYDDILYITSLRNRKWWRNLRGGEPVKVRLEGRDIYARSTLVEDSADVLENFKYFFQKRPEVARHFGVRFESNDRPNTQDISKLAQERVLVKVCLTQKI
jgi:hypothetical protein